MHDITTKSNVTIRGRYDYIYIVNGEIKRNIDEMTIKITVVWDDFFNEKIFRIVVSKSRSIEAGESTYDEVVKEFTKRNFGKMVDYFMQCLCGYFNEPSNSLMLVDVVIKRRRKLTNKSIPLKDLRSIVRIGEFLQ